MLISGQEKRSRLEWRYLAGKGIARVRLSLLTIALCLTGLTGVAAASAAPPPADFTLAWGGNNSEQLGVGTTTDSPLPVPVHFPAGADVTAIAAGAFHSLALTSDGRVLAWGWNIFGQLGNGSTVSSYVPVPVHLPAGAHITAIAADGSYSLALTSDGCVLAWGDNESGQLGNGTTTTSALPVPVNLPAGARVTAIAANYWHTLALTSGGRVLAWGTNYLGELGVGSNTLDSTTPVWVHLPPGTRVTAVAGGSVTTSLAVTCDGRVLAWGDNDDGQLGVGSNTPDSTTPAWVHLPLGTRVTAVAAGDGFSLALTSHGHVLAWGYNSSGQLGNATTTSSSVPVWTHLPWGTRVTAIAGGEDYSLALAMHARRCHHS